MENTGVCPLSCSSTYNTNKNYINKKKKKKFLNRKQRKTRKALKTLAALVRRSPLSPTEMLRTSFWTLISLIGLANFASEAWVQFIKTHNKIWGNEEEMKRRFGIWGREDEQCIPSGWSAAAAEEVKPWMNETLYIR